MLIPHAVQTLGTWSGGTTQSIYVYPPKANLQAQRYLAWVNTATIERTADYSYFPGYTRLHLLLTDPGIRLHFRDPDETVDLAKYHQYRFDGARPLRASLIDGPVSAFNVIMRTGVDAFVSVRQISGEGTSLTEQIPNAPQKEPEFWVIYALGTPLVLSTKQASVVELGSGDAYILEPEYLDGWSVDEVTCRAIEGDSLAIICRITMTNDARK